MSQLVFLDIFQHVQTSASCHQKYMQVLKNLYKSIPHEQFVANFMQYINIMFRYGIEENKEAIQRCFKFCGTFCSNLFVEETEHSINDTEVESNPFLVEIIKEILKYNNLDYVHTRFHSCQFITALLNSVTEDSSLDGDLCDQMQEAMLQRITDINSSVRIQAVYALEKLQDPGNAECPVIKAYILAMGDSHSGVRKAAVDKIAPCIVSTGKIVKRLRDVEQTVRLAAFRKCAFMGPRILRIVDRQAVVLDGINDQSNLVRKIFSNVLLKKWLATYNGDFIKLLNGLKLDADENDIKQTAVIFEKVLEIFFHMELIKDMIEVLPLNEDKLVSIDQLSVELVSYWFYLLNFLRSKNNMEHLYDSVTPELLPLCKHIEGYIQEKTSESLENWEYLEFQQILCKLFQIAGQIDLPDEILKNALYSLILKIIVKIKLEPYVLSELIIILKRIIPAVDVLSDNICHAISNIREPLVDEGPDPNLVREKSFREAQIRVKLNLLNENMEEAISNTEFQRATEIQKEITLLEQQLEDIKRNFQVVRIVKKTDNDPKTLCRCFDIIIALLQNIPLHIMPVSIRNFKDEFIMSLTETSNMDLYCRVFKFSVLFALKDKQFALETVKMVCGPVTAYRFLPQCDKTTLLVSISGISDLIRLYGPNLFTNRATTESTKTTLSKTHKCGRRLYGISHLQDTDSIDLQNTTCKDIIDIILDMMDDELQDIRECSTSAITSLVERGLLVSSSLMSRLLLKILNPVTEKHDPQIQQKLTVSILHYAQTIKSSTDILKEAIIPTLCSIGNAPKTSPFVDIDARTIINFLATLIRCKKNDCANACKNLAYSICHKIVKNPQDQCVPILVRMLMNLDDPVDDHCATYELIKLTETCLKIVVEKHAVKNLKKYNQKLQGYSISQVSDMQSTITTICHSSVATSANDNLSQTVCITSADKELRSKSNDMPGTTIAAGVTLNERMSRRNNLKKSERNHSNISIIVTPTSKKPSTFSNKCTDASVAAIVNTKTLNISANKESNTSVTNSGKHTERAIKTRKSNYEFKKKANTKRMEKKYVDSGSKEIIPVANRLNGSPSRHTDMQRTTIARKSNKLVNKDCYVSAEEAPYKRKSNEAASCSSDSDLTTSKIRRSKRKKTKKIIHKI